MLHWLEMFGVTKHSHLGQLRNSGHWSALVTLILGFACLICSCGSAPTRSPRKKPNVLLVVMDTVRADSLSYAGYDRKTSPTLDRLAEQSYVFTQAVSVGGNTPTAMAGIMTGRWSHYRMDPDWTAEQWTPRAWFGMERFYRSDEELGIPTATPALAERLSMAGYTTAGYINNAYLKRGFHFDRGFDRYDDTFRKNGRVPYGHGEDATAEAIEFLESNQDLPFFLYVHYMDAHAPYRPPEPFRSKFLDSDKDLGDTPELVKRFDTGLKPDDADAEEITAHMRAVYDGSIAFIDDCIGQVLEAVEEAGQADNTIVVVTADHGEEFFEHGRTGHKGGLYEEIVRVPLLIYVPWAAGGTVDQSVRNFDLMPTILELAEVDGGSELDAVSLTGVIRNQSSERELSTFASFPWRRMLRGQRYKLVESHTGRAELYDLLRDPAEQQDLMANQESQSRVAGIAGAMLRELALLDKGLASGASPRVTGDEAEVGQETLEQLRTLGYIK